MIYMHLDIDYGREKMEIKSNIAGMVKTINRYDGFKDKLLETRKELVDIMTDVDDYWSGRSGDSFKYICWYLKLLLDIGSDEFSSLRDEIDYAKESMYDNDYNLSSQMVSRK